MLAVTLGEEVIAGLADWAASHPGVEMIVDLERNVIAAPGLAPIPFSIDSRVRNKFLLGLFDDLEEMREHAEAARALRNEDRNRRPWIYTNATGPNR